MVTGADVADVFVFDGVEGIMLEQQPDPSTWPRIREAWEAFALFLSSGHAPPLTDRDVKVREDLDWINAATAYLALRTEHDALGTRVDEAKSLLTSLASHAKEQGGGVVVSRFFKRGSIAYAKIPEPVGVDTEPYRSGGREEVRISVAK